MSSTTISTPQLRQTSARPVRQASLVRGLSSVPFAIYPTGRDLQLESGERVLTCLARLLILEPIDNGLRSKHAQAARRAAGLNELRGYVAE